MTKTFVYLVQGRSDLVEAFRHLGMRHDADARFLTYDKEINGATYFPNSTWPEGRNRQLQEALNGGSDYLYFIFCDDDIRLDKGDWDVWEEELIRYCPAVAIPQLPKMSRATKPFQKLGFRYQAFLDNDEMLMAFHRDVVADGLVVPYQTRFDHLNWWAACRIQEILIQNLYPKSSIQFNKMSVFDTMVERYDASDRSFITAVGKWLGSEFADLYVDKGEGGKIGRLRSVLRRTMAFAGARNTTTTRHCLDEALVAATFAPGSDLLAQYRERAAIRAVMLQMSDPEV